jgi:uncharacterized DUF497 family protein
MAEAGGAEFDWDESNVSHISRHRVAPEEAEEVLSNNAAVVEIRSRRGEARILAVGETDGGRALAVVFPLLEQRIRVVTAYPANAQMRRAYRLRKGDTP